MKGITQKFPVPKADQGCGTSMLLHSAHLVQDCLFYHYIVAFLVKVSQMLQEKEEQRDYEGSVGINDGGREE